MKELICNNNFQKYLKKQKRKHHKIQSAYYSGMYTSYHKNKDENNP